MCIKWLAVVVAIVGSTSGAFAQGAAHEHSSPSASQNPAPKSEAARVFDQLKQLAGSWEGRLSTFPEARDVENARAEVTLRVASMGHTLVHDMTIQGRDDHPFTMLVVDADRLLLTHYCDADNRPRMIGTMSPDGKTVEFEFVDISGNLQFGHMHRAVFTFIDADHHTEDWTFMMPGDKPVRAHFDLQRATSGTGRSAH
jgi:hypothetical protein